MTVIEENGRAGNSYSDRHFNGRRDELGGPCMGRLPGRPDSPSLVTSPILRASSPWEPLLTGPKPEEVMHSPDRRVYSRGSEEETDRLDPRESRFEQDIREPSRRVEPADGAREVGESGTRARHGSAEWPDEHANV